MGRDNNERLEFLGDAILNFVIADALFQCFPVVDEGVLSRLRANIVKGETLAVLAREIRLGDRLLLGAGEMKSGGYRRDSILAGALESIIGAVYLDGGMGASREFILSVFSDELAKASPDKVIKDAKTRLQELLQSRQKPLPVYTVSLVEGQDHDQIFHISCAIEGLSEAVVGCGGSRRKAEQNAAEKALRLLNS